MTTATLERPPHTRALPRRCEVLLRLSGEPGGVTRRVECGEKAASLCRAVCSCGHGSERWACRECAASLGTCRLCWDEGHECPVAITRIGD